MNDFLFGEKEILNYIEDISAWNMSRDTFSFIRKKYYLPTVKIFNSKEHYFATTQKLVKAWLSLYLIDSFFKNNFKMAGFKFLFGPHGKDGGDITKIMAILQTIWIDD
ncbi:MAG: hypothetical protein SFW66_08940 [Gammaproteobacteria bacterium]|nr:hypothetical protein [Gammaproteobacteria bacterium]